MDLLYSNRKLLLLFFSALFLLQADSSSSVAAQKNDNEHNIGEKNENSTSHHHQFGVEDQLLVYSAMLAMALASVVWGSIRSLAFVRWGQATVRGRKWLRALSMTTKLAKIVPLALSFILLAQYVVFKATDGGGGGSVFARIGNSIHPTLGTAIDQLSELVKAKEHVLIRELFCFLGSVALAVILKPLFSAFLRCLPIGDRWPRRDDPSGFTHFVIAFIPCTSVSALYRIRRHWISNNLLGIAFSICIIEHHTLASFKAGVVLLSGLLIYDVLWVFGTGAMATTTVARDMDMPVLLQFPVDLLHTGWLNANKFFKLGLGDVVVPGMFIALLHRFDNHLGIRCYFVAGLFAYAIGLSTAMGVAQYFQAAQPALLYLVPTCVLIPMALAAVRGELEFSALWRGPFG